MVTTLPPRRVSLREAESKLVNFDYRDPCHVLNLRTAFLHPSGITAEDVFVQREFCTKRGIGNPNFEELCAAISQQCLDQLRAKYSAPSREKAKLLLKIYLLDISDGNREARIFSADSGIGAVMLSLGWVLALNDGSVVLDGGRLHEIDSHCKGIGDMLYLSNPEKTLRTMAKYMCDRILNQTNIKS